MKATWISLAAAAAFAATALYAKAPADAPAGTTGLCKDGTYTDAATKSGACSGHKGVKTWYGAAKETKAEKAAAAKETKAEKAAAAKETKAEKAAAAKETKAEKAAAKEKAAEKKAEKAAPKSTAAAAPAEKSTAMSSKPAAAGGGAGKVWLNTDSKVYHCSSDALYGKTKQGEYMSEAQAKAAGGRPSRGKECS